MNQPKPQAIENLFSLMRTLSSAETYDHFSHLYDTCQIRYGDMKKQLAEDMVAFISPIRARAEAIRNGNVDGIASGGMICERLAPSMKVQGLAGVFQSREEAAYVMERLRPSLEEETRHFPPLLILHGEADSSIPVGEAYRLRDAVIAQGGEVEMHIYLGAEHSFCAPWSPKYSEPEAVDSQKRAIEFLARKLK